MVFKIRNNYKWIIIIIIMSSLYFIFRPRIIEGHKTNNEWHSKILKQSDKQSDIEHSHPHHWATNYYNTVSPIITDTSDENDFITQAQEDGYNCYLEISNNIIDDCELYPGSTQCQLSTYSNATSDPSDPSDTSYVEGFDIQNTASNLLQTASSGGTFSSPEENNSIFDLFTKKNNFPTDRLVPILNIETPIKILYFNDNTYTEVIKTNENVLLDRTAQSEYKFKTDKTEFHSDSDSDFKTSDSDFKTSDSDYYNKNQESDSISILPLANSVVFGPVTSFIQPINAITLTCSDPEKAPTKFILYGSKESYATNESGLNNTLVWNTIAQGINIKFQQSYQTNLYLFANRRVYTSFKIKFESDTPTFSMSEIQLFLDKDSGRSTVYPSCNQ